jgi:hypothetical protein
MYPALAHLPGGMREPRAPAGEDVRVTATRRKDGEHVPTRDDTVQGVARQMELRGEETRAREVAEFYGVHNEAIRQAAGGHDSATGEDISEEHRQEAENTPSDAFDAVHGQTQQQAGADASERAQAAQDGRLKRIAAWWHNMNQSFTEWRSDVRERASDTWNRIRGGPEPEDPESGPDYEQD